MVVAQVSLNPVGRDSSNFLHVKYIGTYYNIRLAHGRDEGVFFAVVQSPVRRLT